MAPEPVQLDPDVTGTVNYASAISSALGEDISRVHVLVTAALGLAAVVVTQLPLDKLRGLPTAFRVVTVVGIVLLVLSAMCLFTYTQKLNHLRITLVYEAHHMSITELANHWQPSFATASKSSGKVRLRWVKKPRRWTLALDRPWTFAFDIGQRFLISGGALLSLVIARLLLG